MFFGNLRLETGGWIIGVGMVVGGRREVGDAWVGGSIG